MIYIEGLAMAGAAMAPALRLKCEDALWEGGDAAATSATLQFFLEIAHARTTGLQECVEDPFVHVPRAIRRLGLLCDRINADALITAQEWAEVRREAQDEAVNTGVTTPDLVAEACMALGKHTLEEESVLHAALLAIGMTDGSAADIARRTATAGFAITAIGGEQEWARLLARGNRSSLPALGPAAQKLARHLQASVVRRFMRITRFEDIGSAQEEVKSVRKILGQPQKPRVQEKKMLNNPCMG